jgi:hypothetical protein
VERLLFEEKMPQLLAEASLSYVAVVAVHRVATMDAARKL